MTNKQTIKEYFFIALGTFIVAIGVYYFMVPQHLAVGGVSGLSIVINSYIPLPISVISLIVNAILLLIGFILIGKEFGGKTIYSVVLLSVFMSIMENVYPATEPVTDELLLNLFCGLVLSTLGVSIVFNQNASTGGTDIVAKIFNKYFNLDMGAGLMAADIVIVSLAFVTYGVNAGIIGLFGWFLNGQLVNYFIDGFNLKKEVVIISNEPERIKQFILNDIRRGVTIYKAQGGYTNATKDILVTILSKNEYFRLKKELAKMDSECFLTIRNVHEVLGAGFSKM